jgi:hypothetical protein
MWLKIITSYAGETRYLSKLDLVMNGFESCRFFTMSASVWLLAVAVSAMMGTYIQKNSDMLVVVNFDINLAHCHLPI